MAGKGSKRRPRFISREEWERRHKNITWNKDKQNGSKDKQTDKDS